MPSNPWIPVAREIATEVGVPFPLFAALIDSESGWDPEARSPVGAYGLGQLMPGTARGLGVDPNDPRQNLTGAARYLKTQLEAFKDIRLALAAYNAGPGAVRKYGGIPPYRETQNYVETVLGRRSRYKPTAPGAPGAPAPQAPRPTFMPPAPPAEIMQLSRMSGQTPILGIQYLQNREQGFDPIKQLQQLALMKAMSPTKTTTTGKPMTLPSTTPPSPDASDPTPTPGQLPGSDGKMPRPVVANWAKLKGISQPSQKFMLRAIKKAQALGLRVGENPYLDPVDGNHVNGSFHYQNLGTVNGKTLGRAIDISGDAKAMDAFFRWAIRFRPTELFYDPLGKYDNGSYSTDGIGNHTDHVHLSV